MKKLLLTLLMLPICLVSYAQYSTESIKRATATQLSTLVHNDSKGDDPGTVLFSFADCDLKMRANVNGGDSKFSVDVVWDMTKSTHVFYVKKDEPNRYEINPGVPTEDIQVKFNVGKKLSINATLDEGDSVDEISIKTSDEKEVEELVFRLTKIAESCRSI